MTMDSGMRVGKAMTNHDDKMMMTDAAKNRQRQRRRDAPILLLVPIRRGFSKSMLVFSKRLVPLIMMMVLASNGVSPLAPRRPASATRHMVSRSWVKPQSLKSQTDDEENSSADGDDVDAAGDKDSEMFQTSEVRIDDGGSDLTDRFKYKVCSCYAVGCRCFGL